MTQQTRRQFFKTLAATAIAGTAAVVVPAVVRGERPGIANGIDCDAPLRWENYYKDYPGLNQKLLEKFEKCFRNYEWAKYHDPLVHFPSVKK